MDKELEKLAKELTPLIMKATGHEADDMKPCKQCEETARFIAPSVALMVLEARIEEELYWWGKKSNNENWNNRIAALTKRKAELEGMK